MVTVMPGPLIEALDLEGRTVGIAAVSVTLPAGVALAAIRWSGTTESVVIPASPHPQTVVLYPKVATS